MRKFGLSFWDELKKFTSYSGRRSKGEQSFLSGLSVDEVVVGASQFEDDGWPQTGRQHRRLVVIVLVVVLAFGFLVYQLFDLQIIHGQENLFLAEQNYLYWEEMAAPRGIILSAEDEVLARNKPVVSVTVLGSQLVPAQKESLLKELAVVLPIKAKELESIYRTAQVKPQTPRVLMENLDQAAQIRLRGLAEEYSGLGLLDDQVRSYPESDVLAAVLGYTALISPAELKSTGFADYSLNARVGREGLEREYESMLRSRPGQRLIQVDVQGGTRRVLREETGASGRNLVLSLRADRQRKAFEILQSAMRKYAATGAVFAAMQVETGQILSLITLPTYDNNDLSKVKPLTGASDGGEEAVLFNRAIAGLYPAGSTVKPAVAAAALQEGIITPYTRISDYPQVIKIGGWEFPDWTVSWGRGAHGWLDVKEAIAESCDLFFYKVGGGFTPQQGVNERVEGLGVEKLKVYLKLFGLGEGTGVDLPGEVSGLVPDPIWKEQARGEDWFLGNTYHLSIGQGDLLVTPLQVLNMTNAIAHDGRLLVPRLVERIEDEQGAVVESFDQAEVIRQGFIDPQFMRVIREGMRRAVSEGIVYPLRHARVAVAAKTGTAEFGTPNVQGEYKTHAWVTGFAPYEDPQISFVVLLESGGASSNAAEVAREILDEYFDEYFKE